MLSTARIDLPALIGRFHAEHPGVVVRTRIFPGGSSDLAREVASGGLDLAVLPVPGDPPAGLVLRPLSEEPLVLVCHPAHPLAGESGVPLDRLSPEPFIDFPAGWGNRAAADRAFAAAGLDRQVAFKIGDFATAAGLVRHGLGVAFIPASVAAGFDGVSRCEVSAPLVWPISVATPATRRPSAAARAFLAYLRGR